MIEYSADTLPFERKIKELAELLPFLFKDILEPVGKQAEQQAKSDAPVKTGRLRKAIKFSFSDNNMTARLSTMKSGRPNVPYAGIIENGGSGGASGNGELLAFKINGEWKKVAKTNGFQSNPFMRVAWNDNIGEDNGAGLLLQEILKRLEA